MAEDWIRVWLKEWAIWQTEQLTGYSSTTVIGRAMAGDIGNPCFAGTVPDIDPPTGWMRRLVSAMNSFQGKKEMRAIYRCQVIYLYGSDTVQQVTGKTERQVRRWKVEGERLLKQELG